ncbi:MAG TPA: glycoside hydrolase family 19 protein [Rhodococcus sp. (in: high G+C Gram-positive bacteria)]|uniref:glycoside hydrolase family 19 protein n=1 Tax=Rhodococcus sp. SJ-3 TaxID=3454628 RepID=UPI002D8FC565|nr:glycoside hydrolase family 19 protein [Rhodococcus sp. (in: high G+C Gram-positive bacteria)]
MSLTCLRHARVAIAAAALIGTATSAVLGFGASDAHATPMASAHTRYEASSNVLEVLELSTLAESGWSVADDSSAPVPAEASDASAGASEAAPPEAPAPAPPAVTTDDLRMIVPEISAERIDQYIAPLNEAMTRNGIDTPVRQAAFIAQLAVESDSFRTFEEYASGRAYEGRADLGNVHPGDGERYKGRGAIQVTGRHNYEELSRHTGVDFVTNPELLAAPENAFVSAAWYWTSRNLNQVADTAGIVRVSEVVNGGHHALTRRIADFERGLHVLLAP